MIDITNTTDAALDFIFAKALIVAAAAAFEAPVYDGTPMISVELCTFDRLPTHPDYQTDPTFSRIRVRVCGGMPLGPRKRKEAHRVANEISEVVNTPIIFEGLTGTDR